MATRDQQQQFVTAYGPYAAQAGQRLGVAPSTVLGQWAFESNWGTSGSAAAAGNMAGINVPGSQTGTNYQGFNSPQAFTDTYVNTIQTNFPGSMNTGSNTAAFNSGLQSGRGGRLYYTGDSASYGAGLASNAATIGGLAPGLSTNTGSVTTSSGSPTAGGATNAAGEPIMDPTTGAVWTPGDSNAATGGGIKSIIPGVGYPIDLGIQTGITQLVQGAETAVGNAFRNAWAATIGQVQNMFVRAGLILAAIVLISLAFWRLMDPDGSKTARLATIAAL